MAEKPNPLHIVRFFDPAGAWDHRWTFSFDMNRDNEITVSDVWLCIQWVMFAPGDAVLLTMMTGSPQLAKFFELSPSMLYGGWSFVISLVCWLIAWGALAVLSAAWRPA